MANLAAWLRRTSRALPGLAASKGLHPLRWCGRLFVCLMVCCIGVAAAGPAEAGAGGTDNKTGSSSFGKGTSDLSKILKVPTVASTEPMLLQADEMVYDNENNKVTAKGNVEIYYGDYMLLADQVVYDRNNNTLSAQGNVRIKDPAGAVITADHMTLTDDFRDGFIDALNLVTKEDTRISAETATREAGNVTVFQNGWFTPCKPCETDPSRPPTWRIRATKIIDRKDEATLTFRNAFFDFFGVPIVWVPYFQTADPTVKRKSGFLIPTYGSGRLGTTVTVPYYFALSDDYDFTFAPMYTDKAGILLHGLWRQQLRNGAYNIDLAGVFNRGFGAFATTHDFRGSMYTQGKFSLDPYWSWGWDVQAVTDDTFRRYYYLDSKLKTDQVSQLYLEGLHDRDYFSMRFYNTGGLEYYDTPISDAWITPVIDYDYIVGQPILGGELSFNSNLTTLTGNGAPDSTRLTTEANWRRQMIDPIGEVFTPFAQLRGDLYDVSNFTDSATGLPADGSTVRGNAVAGAEYRYPFVATTGSVTHIFEPIAQIIARPDSVGDQSKIPNEDANSLVFDDTILFDINKFSGYDRVETGTRANVGVRYTAQLYSGAYARAVFGESYQLAGENPFALQTGLGTTQSDYVTGLFMQATSGLTFSAQTRFDESTLAIKRTDLGAQAQYGPVEIKANYASVEDAAGLGQGLPQQEILTNASLALTEDWSLLGSIRYDLGTSKPIADGIGLQYKDDCFTLGVTYEQTYITELDIQPEKRFLVSFNLKYLGAYQYQTDAFGLLSTASSGPTASGVASNPSLTAINGP